MSLNITLHTEPRAPGINGPESATRARLKIALVAHDLHERGGHSLYTKMLAQHLSHRHEVAVFANVCERPADALWTAHHVRAWRMGAQATVQTFPLGLKAHAARLDQYQIRHMQGYCGGEPDVTTAHICVAAYLESLRDVSLRHRLSLQMMAAAEARFYRNYDGRTIAISHKVARELREYYNLRGPLTVIPHAVEAARFESSLRAQQRESVRAELGIGEEELLVLYAGDLTKSHAYLKELAAIMPRARFVIVTASRAYHWRAPNVSILPQTSMLERYYAAADAFAFPTTYDAFGMVLLEAMASGLPVFSSERAGAAELIENGVEGFIIPLDQWVETTAALLKDRVRLREVGRAAELSARRRNWASVVEAVERVYFKGAF